MHRSFHALSNIEQKSSEPQIFNSTRSSCAFIDEARVQKKSQHRTWRVILGARMEATPPQFRSGEMEFGSDEIHALISCPPETGGSFTALLELPPTQAVELLAKEDSPAPVFTSGTFPIDRASKYSVFASAQNSPERNAILPVSSPIKQEPLDSTPTDSDRSQKSGKRKGREKRKKVEVIEGHEDGGELPYVHVRARRGQATDSHSLAERARREKINARMKLLQELVPGCNKISGTASVLDEIINHVQALQRQVEFLSMSLAAVNPIIDINLDALLAAQSGLSIDNDYMGLFSPPILPEEQINGSTHPQYEQVFQSHQPENSFLSYDSSANSGTVSLRSSQLKMEL